MHRFLYILMLINLGCGLNAIEQPEEQNGRTGEGQGTESAEAGASDKDCGSTDKDSRVRFFTPTASKLQGCKLEKQTRTCMDGKWSPWSGKAGEDTCREVDAPCEKAGAFEERTRFAEKLLPYNGECQAETQKRVCQDGEYGAWSGTFTEAECSTETPLACGDIPHEGIEEQDFYISETVPYDQECLSERVSRQCTNGVFGPWSGQYRAETCRQLDPGSCSDEYDHDETENRTRYLAEKAPAGGTCESEVQSRLCTNGVFGDWSGTFTIVECFESCGDTQHGDLGPTTRTKYLYERVPHGNSCISEVQRQTCNDGELSAFDGTYTFDTCTVSSPLELTLNAQEDVPGFLDIPSPPEGATLSAASTDGQHATVTVEGIQRVRYEPELNYNGADAFQLTLTTDGTFDTYVYDVTVAVSAVNDPPVAEPLTMNLESYGPVTGQVVATDIDNFIQDLIFEPVGTVPGKLEFGANGNFTYYPLQGIPEQNLSVRVSDGNLHSAPVGLEFTFPTMDYSYPDKRAEATLVVYNSNYVGAPELANYYAEKRNIPANQLCPVALPAGLEMTQAELMQMRQTVIESCLCPLVPDAQPCTASNTTELAKHSPFSHLAIIRGIPHHLNTHTIPGGAGPRPMYFLAMSIYQPVADVFQTDRVALEFSMPDWNQTTKGISEQYPRHSMVYSRIDGFSVESTKRIIDRTLLAEQSGPTGKLIRGIASATQDTQKLQYLTGEFDPVCIDYINQTGQLWPHEQCETGYVNPGIFPGATGQSTPKVYDASFFMNRRYSGNGHATANGDLSRLLNWRRDTSACTPLCKDHPDPAACRANSTDFFKEINSDCVGGGNGFMGMQLRSYPVQYFGAWPPGFPSAGYLPPILVEQGGFTDANFTDTKFIRFAGQGIGNTARFAAILAKNLGMNPEWTSEYQFKIRHRFRSNSSQANIRSMLVARTSKPRSIGFILERSPLSSSSGEWTLVESEWASLPLSLLEADETISYISMDLRTIDGLALVDLDIDAVEVLVRPNETGPVTNLIDHEEGSFNAPYLEHFQTGDYAGIMMERMGAIAWWGSGNHFRTGGWAFSKHEDFIASMSKGMTLAENVFITDNHESGLIYGDPLYSALDVQLHLGGEGKKAIRVPYHGSGHPYEVRTYLPDTYLRPVLVNAMFGRDDQTRWAVHACPDKLALRDCADSDWSEVFAHNSGPVANYALPMVDLRDLFSSLEEGSKAFLRLKVWRQGNESKAYYDYGGFTVVTQPKIEELISALKIEDTSWPGTDTKSSVINFDGWFRSAVLGADRLILTLVPGAADQITDVVLTHEEQTYELTRDTSAPPDQLVFEIDPPMAEGEHSLEFVLQTLSASRPWSVLKGDYSKLFTTSETEEDKQAIGPQDLSALGIMVGFAEECEVDPNSFYCNFLDANGFRYEFDYNQDGVLNASDQDDFLADHPELGP